MFEALMQTTPDSIVFADLSGRYIEVSQKKADNWGRSRREMVGLTDFDFMDEQEAKQAREDSLTVIKTGKPITNCVREAIRNGKKVWYSLSEQPWFDNDGKIIGTISISRDITETEKLKEALRMFFGDAAHEMKSPLFAANGNLGSIIKGRYGTIQDVSVLNALKNLLKNYQIIEARADESLGHVALLAHKENNHFISNRERIDIGKDVFDFVLDFYADYLEENNVFIEASMGLIPPGEVFVYANLKMLRAVVKQFTTNSVKYGKINRDCLYISYGYWIEDGKLFMNYYNDGDPIDEKFIQEGLLGKPFERSNETSITVEGTGLGLHMVVKFMEMMGGGFRYENTPSGHPNFIIWLPME